MAENRFDHLSGVRHIVWDWNGTLLDDNHANLTALNRVCEPFGRAPVDLDYWRTVFRRPLLACYEDHLGRPLDEGEWAWLNTEYDRHYRAHLPGCGLAAGVPDVLVGWGAAGGSQSLLSMASHGHVVDLVAERGLSGHFTRVDGRKFDAADDSKAQHLVHHLGEQGIDPATVVLIGDIDDDARAAREAGAHALLVSSGMMSRERLEATGGPVVGSPVEAVRALTEVRSAA
ncbi:MULTISPECIES: HAD family hydrolase [Nocardiopsis]|uniref:HAD family hydrolase n=1 Tax=Nocardiopsis TaxID=2013 RepID=UPI00034D73FD|nr:MULTISPECIES: HAD hydrolase-like protein [Nocardiopsis]